jgi:hypothetical protein
MKQKLVKIFSLQNCFNFNQNGSVFAKTLIGVFVDVVDGDSDLNLALILFYTISFIFSKVQIAVRVYRRLT